MRQAPRSSRRAAAAAALMLSACVAAAGAGTAGARPEPLAAQASRPDVRLTVAFTRAGGEPRRVAHLRCTGSRAVADGFLRAAGAARACLRARRAMPLLTTQPPSRVCTQIYGGPERATVTGRIGTRRVARRFARTDGCQIAEWRAVEPLLPRPRPSAPMAP